MATRSTRPGRWALMLPFDREHAAVRPAAVPRRRRADAGPGGAGGRRHAGRGLAPAGWREPDAVRNVWRLVERYRPARARRRADGAGGGDSGAGERRRHQQPRVASRRRLGRSRCRWAAPTTRCFGVPVIEVYGMTETSSVHTMAYRDRPVRLGSVGHAAALQPRARRQGRRRRPPPRRLRAPTRSASSPWPGRACSPAT